MKRIVLFSLLLLSCTAKDVNELPNQVDLSTGIIRKKLLGGIEINAIRTGWVRIKKTHYELDVPELIVFPTILFQSEWHEWMPIITYLVVHPETTVLVDTGPSINQNQNDYYKCDPNNEFFYQRALRFYIPEEETLKNRLAQLSLEPSKVKTVLISHFHADHIGSLNEFKTANVYTGTGNWPKHIGSFTCNLSLEVYPKEIPFVRDDESGFGQSFVLTKDKIIKFVPLIGHTPGHSGLLIDGHQPVLIAGDATFNEEQTKRGAISGVSQDVRLAKQTQADIKRFLERNNSILLPAHDESIFEKLK